MRIQVFSDTHLEAFSTPTLLWKFVKPKAKVAVVAGDIDAKTFEMAVNEIASKFEQVICVAGNHERYKKDISWMPDTTKLAPNVAYLDPGVFEYKDVVFIGATLWTDFKNLDWFVMNGAKRCINDFHVIRSGEHRFTPQMALDRHVKEKKYIKMMIENFRQHDNKKIVVVTHFLPSYQCVDPKWKKNPGEDTLNYYFSASCDDLLEMEGITTWINGHTHDAYDKKVAGTRVVCNPFGYPGENSNYQDKVIVV